MRLEREDVAGLEKHLDKEAKHSGCNHQTYKVMYNESHSHF